TVRRQSVQRDASDRAPGTVAGARTTGLWRALYAAGNQGLGSLLHPERHDRCRPDTVGAAELVDAVQRPDRLCADGPAVRRRMAGSPVREGSRMSWLPLTELLLEVDPRSVTNQPPLSLEQLQQQALQLAGG